MDYYRNDNGIEQTNWKSGKSVRQWPYLPLLFYWMIYFDVVSFHFQSVHVLSPIHVAFLCTLNAMRPTMETIPIPIGAIRRHSKSIDCNGQARHNALAPGNENKKFNEMIVSNFASADFAAEQNTYNRINTAIKSDGAADGGRERKKRKKEKKHNYYSSLTIY